MSSRTVHVISHSHWDREWYMPYEKHHVRLIELMDSLLELLETDPEFRSFHLDGQTIMLEDYLQVRPERKALLEKHVREGRLQIGPWYVLQDEFLTSSEANIRNLQIGLGDAKAYGAVCKIGYFPDSFGNMGQAPQLLRQAGMDTAVFGRGVKPVGFNNEASGDYESAFSEMNWQSPDGSSVLGVLFANWYHNGMEIPAEPEQARAYWSKRIGDAEKYASTPHLLFMNGCDHQPVQRDLSAVLRMAQRLFPETAFVHSDFPSYVASVKASLPERLSTVRGELRSQRTDGWFTLANTASARVYLKQANQLGQTLLEKLAEPLAAFAAMAGLRDYPHHLFRYAWKTLMQNHPHDSICGCSVDEVHREMMTRFAKSRRVAEEIADDSAEAIARAVDTASAFGAIDPDALPLVVWNTTGWSRTGVVSVDMELGRTPLVWGKGQPIDEWNAIAIDSFALVDALGNGVPAEIRDLGTGFGYELPKDRFREPYMARSVRVTFRAQDVPALGYAAYALVRKELGGGAAKSSDTAMAGNGMASRMLENEFLRVRIGDDGSLTVNDKRNGREYAGIGVYEDVGDIGNEYVFRQPDGDKALTTAGLPARIELVERNALRTVYDIVHEWRIPASADGLLERERHAFVPFPERRAGRSGDTAPLTIATRVTLEAGAPRLKFRTTLNNAAKDHRLRVLFPAGIDSPSHRADSIFEVAVRDTVPAPEWINPSNCQHQQAFVNVSDEGGGLTVANLGLNEYEVLRDGRGTIALTLLRAVGELGDWGVFPTPEAQCLGEHAFEYVLIPHDAGGMTESFADAYQEQVPWTIRQTALREGSLDARDGFVRWSGDGLALSAVKIAEETGDVAVRWFNMTAGATRLEAVSACGVDRWHRSGVLEERGDPVPEGQEALAVRAAEIVTLVGPIRRRN